MLLRKVVMGVDFSASSIAAMKWAAQHFAGGAELLLVHSIFVPEPPSFLRGRFPPSEPLIASARIGAEERLRALAASVGGDGIQTEVRIGRPAGQLLDAAKRFGADLIIIGKHGDPGGIWGRMGSTAEQVVRRSPVPVLLATGLRDVHPRRVLVGVDESSLTPSLRQWIQCLGERFGSEITALHVVSPSVLRYVVSLSAAAKGTDALAEQEVRAELEAEADSWVEGLRATGMDRGRVHGEVAFGKPSEEIVAAAERLGCELIVVGSRRAGALRHTLLGSVTSQVLRSADCPVLVVVDSVPANASASETLAVGAAAPVPVGGAG